MDVKVGVTLRIENGQPYLLLANDEVRISLSALKKLSGVMAAAAIDKWVAEALEREEIGRRRAHTRPSGSGLNF